MASGKPRIEVREAMAATPATGGTSSQPRSAKRRFYMDILTRTCEEGAAGGAEELDALDVADVVAVLRAGGLRLRQVVIGAESDSGNRGLRVELCCRRSGLSAVLDAEGTCACDDAVGSHDASVWEVSGVLSPLGSQESLCDAPVVGSSLLPEPAPEAAAVARGVLVDLVRLLRHEGRAAAAGGGGLRPLAASSSTCLNERSPPGPLRCRTFDQLQLRGSTPASGSGALGAKVSGVCVETMQLRGSTPASGSDALGAKETEGRLTFPEEVLSAAQELKTASQRLASASTTAADAADRLLRALELPALPPQESGVTTAETDDGKATEKTERASTGLQRALPRQVASPAGAVRAAYRAAPHKLPTPSKSRFSAPQRFSISFRPPTPHTMKTAGAGGRAGSGLGSEAGVTTTLPRSAVSRKSFCPSELSPGASPTPSPARSRSRTPARTPARVLSCNPARTPTHTPSRSSASRTPKTPTQSAA